MSSWKLLLFIKIVAIVTATMEIDPVAVKEELDRIDEKYQKASGERTSRLFFYPYIRDYSGYGSGPTNPIHETYDFIVVGSGSAGSVLASRLSEVAGWKTLLLEVGEEATPIADIAAIAPLFQFTDLNWNYLMEKQDNVCLGLEDQRMPWPRGRGLGGSTLINYMIHVRGNRLDYDRWAKLGNPGWSYKDVFKYFTKMEDCQVKIQDPGYHYTGGYLSVTDVPYRTESVHVFVKAAQEAGHVYTDYNGKKQMGVSYVQANLRGGQRCSAERAYLRPASKRPNLTILTNARAIKILIDPETKRAYGIKYIRNRQYHEAHVTKEVILSAGAFNSPQLLMLSGIGPKDHLAELGIPLVQDLPVGQKMYDHITFAGLVFTLNESIASEQKNLENPISFLQLIKYQNGPLTTLGGVEALLYTKTNASKDPKNYPDIEMIFISGSMNTDKGQYYRKTFRITDEIYNTVWKPIEDVPTWSVFPMLLHPKSYGYLKLKSTNPYHWPKLYGNYFTDANNEDIKTFIAAIREIQKISRQPAFQRYGSRQVETKIPGCQHLVFDSDEYWECALRHITPTLHHQVATCKMGPRNDREAVVDEKLRVYGVKNLRVADTSVIPIPLSAHTSVPAYMIGEKLSDMLKQEWSAARGHDGIDIRSTVYPK